MRHWIGLCEDRQKLAESAEVKVWYDALTREVVRVRDHHWTDVEDHPTAFAKFDDDELEALSGDDYSYEWLAATVFANHWVRITAHDARWFFQGNLKDIRKAVRDVVPLDTVQEVVIETVDDTPAVTLKGAAIERFIRSGRLTTDRAAEPSSGHGPHRSDGGP